MNFYISINYFKIIREDVVSYNIDIDNSKILFYFFIQS